MSFDIFNGISGEDLFDAIFSAVSCLGIGIFALIFSYHLKKERMNKRKNSVMAKVVKVDQIHKDVLTYILHLEYFCNGQYITAGHKSFVKFHVGSEIRVLLYGDKIGEILSDVPNDMLGQSNVINLKAYEFINIVGKFFLYAGILVPLLNLYELSYNTLFIKTFIVAFFMIALWHTLKRKRKSEFELKNIDSGKYSCFNSKVIGYEKGFKLSSFKVIDFPIVEIMINGDFERHVLREDVIINSSDEKTNGDIQVYRDKETGKIFTAQRFKETIKICNGILIFGLICLVINYIVVR